MTQNSPSPPAVENSSSAQHPVRKMTWKVIFYVVFALAWIAFFVLSILHTSLAKDWFWECLTFVVSIGGAIVSTINSRQVRARQARTLAGTTSSPTASHFSSLTTVYGALGLIALVTFGVLMYHGNPLGQELLISLMAGSGVTWGFELAHRESRDPIAPDPYRNRQGRYD